MVSLRANLSKSKGLTARPMALRIFEKKQTTMPHPVATNAATATLLALASLDITVNAVAAINAAVAVFIALPTPSA